jgi:hypothetical protein
MDDNQKWRNRKTKEVCSEAKIWRLHQKYLNSPDFAKNNYRNEEFEAYIHHHYEPCNDKFTTFQLKKGIINWRN